LSLHSFYKHCCLLIAILFCPIAFATNHTDSWNSAIITGPISKDKKFQYYIQPGLSFEDDEYKYRSTYLYLGAGYQMSHTVTVWLMNAWHNRLKASGKTLNIETIRQQIDWNVVANESWSLNSVSRLEERKDYAQPQWLLRGREKLTLRVPIKTWQNHSFVTFDEVYLNFNNPLWINNNNIFDLNNVFIGIGTQLSPIVSFDLGYLNQYVMRTTGNKNNNVIYLMFYVKFP
jgi:hypothetical protein